jgi:hypothetical protein
LAPDPLRAVEFTEFNLRIVNVSHPPDGSLFVIEGTHEGPGGQVHGLRALDGLTGELRWARDCPQASTFGWHAADPGGEVLAYNDHDGSEHHTRYVRLATGEDLGAEDDAADGLAPGGRLLLRGWVGGYALVRRGEGEPLVVLGLDREPSHLPAFTRDGALAAWGNADGTVTVCRLAEVRARLDRLGLGWRGPP